MEAYNLYRESARVWTIWALGSDLQEALVDSVWRGEVL